MEPRSPAAYVAEFIGTFALVFFITMAGVLFLAPGGGATSDFAVVGFVNGLVLFMLVYSIGSVSGAHVNPAVTVALAALRKIRLNDAVIYILLQLSGGVAGALVTKFILSDQVADGSATPGGKSAEVGTTVLNHTLLGSTAAGAVAEGIGAFFLVWAVVAVAVNPRAARDWAGLVIGGTLGLVVFVLAPVTGAAINPARWFGPALVSNHWTDGWVFVVGPLVGGLLGGLAYWYLFVEPGPARFRAATPETGPKGLRQDVDPGRR